MKRSLLFPVFVFSLLLATFGSANIKLDQYITKYNQMKTFSADFKQSKFLKAMKAEQKSSGYIKFKREKNQMIWAVEKPYAYQFVLNGNKIIKNYPLLKEREEINIDENIQMKAVFENIFMLMGIKGKKEIENTYQVLSSGLSITLIPKNKEFLKYVSKIVIELSENHLANALKIYEPSGDYTAISFYNSKINAAIAEAEFLK